MQAQKTFRKALMIHRRDLRVQDNTALNAALLDADEVLPCFIFDPMQISDANEYRSLKQIGFMRASLEDLARQYVKLGGKLFFFEGAPEETLANLIREENVDAVFVNADYTPYSKARDAKLQDAAEKGGAAWRQFHDLLLCGDPEKLKNKSGKSFVVFTPFWKAASALLVAKPVAAKRGSFVKAVTSKRSGALDKLAGEPSPIIGGRAEARKILKKSSAFGHYAKSRNDPHQEASRLSAHNKFGTVSIREVYHAFAAQKGAGSFLRQLYWRDFYASIVHFFPYVIGSSYDPTHEKLFWNKKKEGLEAWKSGMTGFPMVDAGMRELNLTGYMHNRARLVAASFLTKDLHVDWRVGERHFAQKLVDYDISVNNGNWQWVAGTGVDPVPYFRIFNPWLQAAKLDPEALYIKEWVPELRDVPAAQIHALYKKPLPQDHSYPQPMLEHAEEMRKVRALYA